MDIGGEDIDLNGVTENPEMDEQKPSDKPPTLVLETEIPVDPNPSPSFVFSFDHADRGSSELPPKPSFAASVPEIPQEEKPLSLPPNLELGETENGAALQHPENQEERSRSPQKRSESTRSSRASSSESLHERPAIDKGLLSFFRGATSATSASTSSKRIAVLNPSIRLKPSSTASSPTSMTGKRSRSNSISDIQHLRTIAFEPIGPTTTLDLLRDLISPFGRPLRCALIPIDQSENSDPTNDDDEEEEEEERLLKGVIELHDPAVVNRAMDYFKKFHPHVCGQEAIPRLTNFDTECPLPSQPPTTTVGEDTTTMPSLAEIANMTMETENENESCGGGGFGDDSELYHDAKDFIVPEHDATTASSLIGQWSQDLLNRLSGEIPSPIGQNNSANETSGNQQLSSSFPFPIPIPHGMLPTDPSSFFEFLAAGVAAHLKKERDQIQIPNQIQVQQAKPSVVEKPVVPVKEKQAAAAVAVTAAQRSSKPRIVTLKSQRGSKEQRIVVHVQQKPANKKKESVWKRLGKAGSQDVAGTTGELKIQVTKSGGRKASFSASGVQVTKAASSIEGPKPTNPKDREFAEMLWRQGGGGNVGDDDTRSERSVAFSASGSGISGGLTITKKVSSSKVIGHPIIQKPSQPEKRRRSLSPPQTLSAPSLSLHTRQQEAMATSTGLVADYLNTPSLPPISQVPFALSFPQSSRSLSALDSAVFEPRSVDVEVEEREPPAKRRRAESGGESSSGQISPPLNRESASSSSRRESGSRDSRSRQSKAPVEGRSIAVLMRAPAPNAVSLTSPFSERCSALGGAPVQQVASATSQQEDPPREYTLVVLGPFRGPRNFPDTMCTTLVAEFGSGGTAQIDASSKLFSHWLRDHVCVRLSHSGRPNSLSFSAIRRCESDLFATFPLLCRLTPSSDEHSRSPLDVTLRRWEKREKTIHADRDARSWLRCGWKMDCDACRRERAQRQCFCGVFFALEARLRGEDPQQSNGVRCVLEPF